MGSHGGFVFGRHGREGGFISVSPTPTNDQQTPVEVHKGKAENETLKNNNQMYMVTVGVWLTQCICFLLQLSGQLVHQQSQLCLEAVKEGGLPQSSPREVSTNTGGLFLRPCTHHPKQQWHFEQLVAPKGA